MFEPGYEQLSGFLCVVQTVISLAGNKINNRTGQESFYQRAAIFKMGEQTVTSLNPGVECVPSTKIVYENANSSPYKKSQTINLYVRSINFPEGRQKCLAKRKFTLDSYSLIYGKH